MRHQHPDDPFALTDHERDQFRRIWDGLATDRPASDASGEPDAGAAEDVGDAYTGWSVALVLGVVAVFVALAVDSAFLVLLAAACALGARLALRRGSRPGGARW
jgi:hypothetical protein